MNSHLKWSPADDNNYEGGVCDQLLTLSLTSRPSLLGSSHPLVSRVSIALHQPRDNTPADTTLGQKTTEDGH